MSRIALAFVACLALGACKDKKPATAEEDPAAETEPECETSDDCDEGYRCAHGDCMKQLRSNNPTAEGVKRDIERHQKRHTDKVDKSLDLPE